MVDNRGGASSTIGMTSTARLRPDGYNSILAPNSTYSVAPCPCSTGHNQERDFTRARNICVQ